MKGFLCRRTCATPLWTPGHRPVLPLLVGSVCCIFWLIYTFLIVAPRAWQERQHSEPCMHILWAESNSCLKYTWMHKYIYLQGPPPSWSFMSGADWCTSPTMQWAEGREMLLLLFEGLEQLPQSGAPGWDLNLPSLCISCVSCDEPLKGTAVLAGGLLLCCCMGVEVRALQQQQTSVCESAVADLCWLGFECALQMGGVIMIR